MEFKLDFLENVLWIQWNFDEKIGSDFVQEFSGIKRQIKTN
jgi:hypothetical protein